MRTKNSFNDRVSTDSVCFVSLMHEINIGINHN